jgi:hypothetical protein
MAPGDCGRLGLSSSPEVLAERSDQGRERTLDQMAIAVFFT